MFHTADTIGPLFHKLFPNDRLLVVSNREPYEHRADEETGEIRVSRPTGGLTSALDPLLQASAGVWIAWGSGDADREVTDDASRVGVPPDTETYTLRRVWLDERDVRYYYLGYSNQFLWPLCHMRPALTRLRDHHWKRYQQVNRRFAAAAVEEAGDASAAIWFHDYHLALAAPYARDIRSDLKLGQFWHIPWPPVEIFDIAPQARELLRGMIANDLVGFQIPRDVKHFLTCAEEILGATVDYDAGTAEHDGHVCQAAAFPISIDVDAFEEIARRESTERSAAALRRRYAGPDGLLAVGVDRTDYSKGIPERLKALEFLFEHHPDLQGRLTFVQVAVPSRTEIDQYDYLANTVERMVLGINDRFGTESWRPVHLIRSSFSPERLAALFRAADLCLVSSLQDGMNLVAKEFVASQIHGSGVLLLSRFAGAAIELDGAVEVNPYDPEGFARAIYSALQIPMDERQERISRMQKDMRSIYQWMADYLTAWQAATVARS